MSATIPLRARRRRPTPQLWALFAFAGCSSGVVEPIVAPVTLDAGDRGGQLDADAASDEAFDRRDTGPLSCEDVAADWPDSAAINETTLLVVLNELRYDPQELCQDPAGPAWGLRPDPELRCVARLGAMDPIDDGADEALRFVARNQNAPDVRDREKRAGLREGTVRLELLITNAESPDEILAQLQAAPGDACRVFDPTLTRVGIAQRGDFWTLDLARGSSRRP